MKDATPTAGFTIGSITLQRTSFEVIGAETEGKTRLTTKFDTKLVSQQEGSLTIDLRLEVDGYAGEVKIWSAWSEHRGQFIVAKECSIPIENIVENYAPAYLYAFGRELIADLARRSMRLLVLPPAVFSPSSQPPKK